ncbi:MAG TPA: hypothetical protein VHM25_14400, partial [Polyangiaceae bacterium]|nr:hypothetical protein [Polyangiaceae bacterium]
MSAVSYLFPLLVLGGLGFWYWRMHQKGKALGGGIAEGFAQAQLEKWGDLLSPGEKARAYGSGILWRPSWQYWLAKQIPLLKLVWPMTVYSLLVTDRGRVLLATYTTFGGLANKEGHESGAVRLSDVTEEKQSWLMGLNPLVPSGGYKSFGA